MNRPLSLDVGATIGGDNTPSNPQHETEESDTTPCGGEKKIAACLTSYKRFDHLQRQIYCMMHQSYPDLHLFVAAKGISEADFNQYLVPQFRQYIDQDRLTLRHFPNKNQLSNFVDTIRGLDISGYDLFAKIDDDDFYHPDYFARINAIHFSLPPHHSSFFCGDGFEYYSKNGFPLLQWEHFYFYGPTMVLSRRAIETLVECERHPDQITTIVPRANREKGNGDFGFTEDNLMRMIVQQHGHTNIAPFIARDMHAYHLIIQKSNASVLRGGYLDQQFRSDNTKISHGLNSEEHILKLHHAGWRDLVCIRNGRAFRLSADDQADVIDFNGSTLRLKWDDSRQEQYARHQGIYHYIPCNAA